mgnify:CR=1 FL=1
MKKFFTTIAVLLFSFLSGFASGFGNEGPENEQYRLLIKFCPDHVFDVSEGELFLSPKKEIGAIEQSLISKYSYRQVMKYSEQERMQMRTGIYLPPRGKNSFNIYRFRGMVYLEGSQEFTLEELEKIAIKFKSLPFVEYTATEPVVPPPPPSNTPDFSHLQDYRVANAGNNVIGLDIDYAWSIGVKGEGVGIADIEWGFNYNHEDLQRETFIELLPTTNHTHDDHGTAVTGVMYAIENGFGMTGMVHEADVFYGISEIPFGRVYGIALGIDNLNEGDVFLYEMQTGGQNGNYVPADFNMAVWDVTLAASNAGIIVVAAAGNGSEDLDHPFYNEYNSRGDNGSIIVGAGTRVGRNRAGFSTYGSRVNLQGWGDWSVATTGYGALYNGGPNATYTNAFSGTSSATPIVASAVVAVQSYAKNVLGIILTPQEMRSLLIETGTSQGSGWGAGNLVPQPNVREAIIELYNMQGGVTNPLNFSATVQGSDIIELNWNKNTDDHDVLLIWSHENVFGTPLQGEYYQAGDPIAGGGMVLYNGANTHFAHIGLNPFTTYYYRIFSFNDSLSYSYGVGIQATTLCEVFSSFPFDEDFDEAPHLPDCWDVIDHAGNGQIWQFGTHSYGLEGTTGNYAFISSLVYGPGQSQNTDLVTPVLDFSGFSYVKLSFTHYFRQRQTNSAATLYFSSDLGNSWTEIQNWNSTTPNPEYFSQDMDELAGLSGVRFKWNYTGSFGFFWNIDDIVIHGSMVPFQPDVISGNEKPCAGSEQSYSVNEVEGVFYAWEFPADWSVAAGGETHSVTVTVGFESGEIKVTPYDSNGSGMAQNLGVNPFSPPVLSAITGPANPCTGDTVFYSVEDLPEHDYFWSVPDDWFILEGQSSYIITVVTGLANGTITIIPANECGAGELLELDVTVESTPALTAITGNDVVCEGSLSVFHADEIPGAVYSWAFPAGWEIIDSNSGHSVEVLPGSESGLISVFASGNCGQSDTISLAVMAKPKPIAAVTLNNNVLYSNHFDGNQWYNQDGAINGAVSQEYTPVENGIYHVIVTINDCSSDPSNSIEILDISIPELFSERNIIVYPNPVAGLLTLEYPGNDKPVDFSIYNVYGKQVFIGRLTEKVVIESGSLPAGPYTIRFKTGNGLVFRKLVIQ